MKNKIAALMFTFFLLANATLAQQPEVTISLNENFFDSLLDAVFQHSGPIEFSLASIGKAKNESAVAGVRGKRDFRNSFTDSSQPTTLISAEACPGTVRVLREMNGVRTAVRFREGRIYAPLAFSGSYSPPFIGCVEFSGVAETVIELEFDQGAQRLIARAQVQNVTLTGAAGLGGTLIARVLQGSIDKKINPIEVVKLDKLSFVFQFETRQR